MAILVTAISPSMTAEQDDEMVRLLNLAGNPPAGALARLAGPAEGGWRILSAWESQEAWDAFRRERVEPALRQAGLPSPQFQVAPLHSVRINPQR